jgi:hypothetical protein
LLRQDVTDTQKALQKQERSIGDTTQAWEKKQREIGTTIAAAIQAAADTIANGEQSQSDNERPLQWGLFFVTLVGAVAASVAAGGAIYYACVARGQLDTSQKQLRQMEAQARVDERAWVFVRNVAPNKNCKWKAIDFVNSGRTPALDFSMQAGFSTVPKGKPPEFIEQAIPGIGTVAPEGTFSSCIGDKSIDKDDWSKYDLFVHGTLHYTDVFETQHWTKFCFQRGPDGNFAPCQSGNGMDRKGIDSGAIQ